MKHNLLGQKKGKLTVVGRVGQQWVCKCECGNEVRYQAYKFIGLHDKISCMDCYLKWKSKTPSRQISGHRFGLWTVLKWVGRRRSHSYWLCQCDCGGQYEIEEKALIRQESKGCRKCAKRKPDREQIAFRRFFKSYQSGAKRRGINWELTEEDFKKLTKSNCFYTGLPPLAITKHRGGSYTYNGIDRIDSESGYCLDNCVPCNTDVNIMKRDMPIGYFIQLCNLICKNLIATNHQPLFAAQLNANSSLIYQALN